MKGIRERILWWAASRRLKKDQPFIIAITGTIAKTSTKETVGCILRKAFGNPPAGGVRVGFGNLNSYLGVPLAILGFKVDFYKKKITWQWIWYLKLAILKSLFGRLPKYLVIELAVDQLGDMKMLLEKIKPDIGIITIVGNAHIENFPSQDDYIKEKSLFAQSVKKDGVLLLNRRDPYLKIHQKSSSARVEYFDCPPEEIAFQAARKLAQIMELEPSMVDAALATCQLPEQRLRVKILKRCRLIDDSYNANPISMEAAFNVLMSQPGRKVVILGDMRELGATEKEEHNKIGQLARRKFDLLIGVGELAKFYHAEHWFNDSTSAAKEVFTLLKEGDSILVKGSHAMKMEIIVKAIENEFS